MKAIKLLPAKLSAHESCVTKLLENCYEDDYKAIGNLNNNLGKAFRILQSDCLI